MWLWKYVSQIMICHLKMTGKHKLMQVLDFYHLGKTNKQRCADNKGSYSDRIWHSTKNPGFLLRLREENLNNKLFYPRPYLYSWTLYSAMFQILWDIWRRLVNNQCIMISIHIIWVRWHTITSTEYVHPIHLVASIDHTDYWLINSSENHVYIFVNMLSRPINLI